VEVPQAVRLRLEEHLQLHVVGCEAALHQREADVWHNLAVIHHSEHVGHAAQAFPEVLC
jgi:hypothetical protein